MTGTKALDRPRELARRNDLLLALSNAETLEDALRVVLDATLWLADMDRGRVWLLDSGAAAKRVALQTGLSDGAVRLLDGCPAGLVAGGPYFWHRDKRAEPLLEEIRRLEGLGPLGLLPIRHGPRLLAALLVGSGGGQAFPARARKAAEFVAVAAGAVIGHKLGELALEDSEAALVALFENTDSSIVLMDRERRLLKFNVSFAEAIREICGTQVRVGIPIEEFLREDLWQWLAPRHRRALAGARLREEAAVVAGPETRHWGVTFNPVISGGQVTGVSIYALDITEHRRTERQLLEKENALRALPRRLVMAQEQERQRVSRELHDEIGQVLTAVKISLQRLKGAANDPRLADIDVGIKQIDRAIDGIRDLSISLRPLHLDELGLGPAIRAHIERLTREGGPRAEVSVPAVGVQLPFEVETACFRIVQEAVTNVLRHAAAERLWVGVEVVAGELRLSVRDDGSGFDTKAARARIDAGQSLGLRSMHERADLLGGRIEIHSGDSGSEVVAWLPLERSGPDAAERNPPEGSEA
jgi:PAS domain S-box-containing protein